MAGLGKEIQVAMMKIVAGIEVLAVAISRVETLNAWMGELIPSALAAMI